MWQYTTETIINSNKGNLVGVGGKKVRVCVYDQEGNAKAAVTKETAKTDTLIIDGVNTFLVKYIKGLHKCAYSPAVPAVLTVNLSGATLKAGSVLRLTVVLTEEGRVSSIMQNAYLFNSKPFHYEVVSTGTAATDAKNLAALINKDMGKTDFDFFTATDAAGVITLTAKDCHIRFKEDEVTLVEAGAAPTGSAVALLGFHNYAAVPGVVVTLDTKGSLGQGTVEHLIKDLRIPTRANLDPFGPDFGGRPVPGGEYIQYLIEYETPRNHVAGGVMGSVGEISRTSHVLFVEKTAAQEVATILDSIKTGGIATLDTVTAGVAPTVAKQTPGSVQ